MNADLEIIGYKYEKAKKTPLIAEERLCVWKTEDLLLTPYLKDVGMWRARRCMPVVEEYTPQPF
jgi:hypothetical protein